MTKKEMEAKRNKKAEQEIQAAAGATEKLFTVDDGTNTESQEQSKDETPAAPIPVKDAVKKSKPKTKGKDERPKPHTDYARVDLVKRGKNQDIITNYKEYIDIMARGENLSMTKYIQNLIEKDMKANKKRFEELSKILK